MEGRGNGWRVVRKMHSVGGITATGPRDVWVKGDFKKETGKRFSVQRWNGDSWNEIGLPGNVITTGPIGSSSRDNVWITADVWKPGTGRSPRDWQTVALRWDGKRFTCSIMGRYGVGELAVLGPRDVWAVGYPSDLRYRVKSHPRGPYFMHWNGERWRPAPTPTPKRLSYVSASSPTDVWALRETSQWAGDGMTFWHWDGQSWGRVRTPPIAPPPGAGIGWGELYDLTALPSGDIWAAGKVGWWKPSDPEGEDAPHRQKSLLLHWDGHRWSSFLGPEGEEYWSIAPDGAGGVWMATDDGYYVHHTRDGAVTRVQSASYHMQPQNYQASMDHLINVPGTTSMLAATMTDDAPKGLVPVLEGYGM
ncbi:MAG: hypothetical protein ACRDT8_02135 [Micromonosporaceae bacterium]